MERIKRVALPRLADYLITIYSSGWTLKLDKELIDVNITPYKRSYSEYFEEAKQIAQKDFEMRVKECIEEE